MATDVTTFAQDIENEAGAEPIEAVTIGPFGWGTMDDAEPYGEDRIARKAPVRRGVKLAWDEARPMLDYAYSTGYGAPECDAIWAWTPTRIIYVWQYDGATGLSSLPRHPQDGAPEMPGG